MTFSIFRRKGRKGVTLKYRDATGRLRMRSFKTRQAAEDKALEFRIAPDPGRHVLFKDQAAGWLERLKPNVRAGTHVVYSSIVNAHLVKALGLVRVDEITRPMVKRFLAQKRTEGFSQVYVRKMRATLHTCLEDAREDGLIYTNPAVPGKALRIEGSRRRDQIKAFDLPQLRLFLATALEHEPRWWPLFRVMAFTGLRIGEAIALKWEDLDLERREARIERNYTRGNVELTKTSRERLVDLAKPLVEDLKRLQATRQAEALKAGKPLSEWLWPARYGGSHPIEDSVPQEAFKRVLKAAKPKLPLHHTPHCLRHTYASILLSRGRSLQYVQRQLGHSSISMTADVYGSWLPVGDHAVVDDLARLVVTPDVTDSEESSPLSDGGVLE